MLRLSKTREREILKILTKHNDFSSGSSRATFLFDSFVIKVAFDAGGFLQNERELKLFKEYKAEHLAKIIAFGDYVIVMERVEILNFEVVEEVIEYEADYNDFLYFDNKEEIIDINEKIEEAVYFLHDINIYTSDNYQVGLTFDNRVVAYDYGYFKAGQVLGQNNLYCQDTVRYLLNELILEY